MGKRRIVLECSDVIWERLRYSKERAKLATEVDVLKEALATFDMLLDGDPVLKFGSGEEMNLATFLERCRETPEDVMFHARNKG